MVAVNSAGMTNLGKQGVITQRASSQSSSAQITTPVAGVATNAAAQSGSLRGLPGRVGSSQGGSHGGFHSSAVGAQPRPGSGSK